MKTLRNRPDRLDLPSTLAQAVYQQAAKVPCWPDARPYHMTISHAGRFIWFRVAKVGTRTIFEHLRQSGLRLDAEHPSFVRYAPGLYRGYFKFAFVRNPWDRLVSCWLEKSVKSDAFKLGPERAARFSSFVDYVASRDLERCDRHIALQSSLIDLNALDFLGRHETFAADFEAVCARLGLGGRPVEPQNVSKGRSPYRDYYDADLRDRVRALYRKDIQLFGYSF